MLKHNFRLFRFSRLSSLLLSSILLTLFVTLYIRCNDIGRSLSVDSYQQSDQGDRVVLVVKGQGFGNLGETQIFINERVLDRGHLLKWSDSEIQLFIRKPFTYNQLQLKQNTRKSQLIPVWNTEYLPQVQHILPVQGFPVLESLQFVSHQPPIIEIQGQNLGFRYNEQLLLFSRRRINSIYFDASQLENYRPLQTEEVLFWTNQNIRVLLPQDAIEGPIFLVRRDTSGKLIPSNNLYLPSAGNHESRQSSSDNSRADEHILRLVLQHSQAVLPSPQFLGEAEQAMAASDGENTNEDAKEQDYALLFQALKKYREAQRSVATTTDSNSKSSSKHQSAAVSQQNFAYLPIAWPRNQRNQSWMNLEPQLAFANPITYRIFMDESEPGNNIPAVDFSKARLLSPSDGKELILPALAIQLSVIPQNIAEKFSLPKQSWLLSPLSYQTELTPLQQAEKATWQQASYLVFRLGTLPQQIPATSRNQNYDSAELTQLRYIFQNNSAILLQYQVPHWQASEDIADNRRPPYWKAAELYKQAVRSWTIEGLNGFTLQQSLSSKIWGNSATETSAQDFTQNLSHWPTDYLDDRGNLLGDDQNRALRPEQILLVLLRAFTEMNIPAQIIAGAQAQLPSIQNLHEKPPSTSLSPYYWLEIYFPNYGWFQLDPIAEIIQYLQTSGSSTNSPDNALQFSDNALQFWGSLYTKDQDSTTISPATLIKLAFFTLGDEWKSFNSSFRQAQNLPYELSWSLQRLR